MQNKEMISRLYQYGHFANPAHKTGVKEEDLDKLKPEDDVVKTAVQSYQEFMAADFDRFALHHHNRIGIADGEIGPATQDLLNVERCGHPDYNDVEMATGNGSWPADCDSDWPGVHTFSINVDKSRMPSFLGKKDDPNSPFEQAFALARLAYAQIGLVLVRKDGDQNAQTQFSFTRGRGWIGLALVGGSWLKCNSTLWCKYDYNYRPSNLVQFWCILILHELGHNTGLNHVRSKGVMSPSIQNLAANAETWIGDPSEVLLNRWFGGEPIPLDKDDPDDPEDPPKDKNEYWFSGGFTLMKGEEEVGEYIITPKPVV